MGFTMLLFAGLGWYTWQAYRYFAHTNATNFRMETLLGTVTHLDEVLTMSARMAAQTGDTKWINRYHSYEPQLDQVIKELTALAPATFLSQVTQIDSANTALVNIENQAFELIRQDKKILATELLNSDQYETQKKIYALGRQNAFETIRARIDDQLAAEKKRILLTDLTLFVVIPLLTIIWIGVIWSTKKHIRDRNLVQTELLLKDRALASASNGIVISDATQPDNPLIYCNDAFTKITGYDAHEVLNQNCRFLQSDDRQQEALEELRKAIKDERETQVILRNYKKDGTLFWNRLTLSPIRDNNDQVTHFIGIQEDITKSKQDELSLHDAKESAEQNAQKLSETLLASEALRKEADEARTLAEISAREAQKANRAKSDFLANMSHEMRTPLNAVLGFTEILNQSITDPTQSEYLHYIQTSGKSLLTLINDILDLAKVEAGKLELREAATNLDNVFQDIRQMFTDQINAKGLAFVVEIAPNVPKTLWLDATRLKQILINLIGNAVKFTQEGHIHLKASCQSIPTSQSHIDLIIDVVDTGIGIPEEEQARIFGAFEQLHQKDTGQVGTGLGLAITHHLVEFMNGSISVHSREDQGTTFHITFKNLQIVESLPTSHANPKSHIDAQFASHSVLIVDDIQSNRELLHRALEPSGLTIYQAANGTQALQMAETHVPNIMLIDIQMPGMNGFELAERIHQNPKLSDTPLIAITASAMKDTESQISQIFDGYVKKPVILQDLYNEINRLFSHPKNTRPTPNPDANIASPQIDPAFRQELINQQNTWEKLQSALIIDEVETFATQIEKLGTQYQSSYVQNWGKQLKNQVESLDMFGIRQTLESFPDLISHHR